MLPLPLFRHHRPSSLEDVLRLLGELPDAKLIAGGTDLLPNMKHGLFEPSHLISLSQVRELEGVTVTGEQLVLGATTTLHRLASEPLVRRHAPALAEAVRAVGGPHHRRMGTLGGNICLDTRCVYYNQTHFWREALGFCLKKDGTACHVVAAGKNCVAAASNDSGPALIALGASIELCSARGVRNVAASDFYTPDGIHNTVCRPSEVVTRVRVPCVAGRASAFEKLRRRGAIDYPLLNLALRADFDDDAAIADFALVVSALAARPKTIKAAAKAARGVRLSDEAARDGLADQLASIAFKGAKTLSNLDNDTDWRRAMVPVLVKRALSRLQPPAG